MFKTNVPPRPTQTVTPAVRPATQVVTPADAANAAERERNEMWAYQKELTTLVGFFFGASGHFIGDNLENLKQVVNTCMQLRPLILLGDPVKAATEIEKVYTWLETQPGAFVKKKLTDAEKVDRATKAEAQRVLTERKQNSTTHAAKQATAEHQAAAKARTTRENEVWERRIADKAAHASEVYGYRARIIAAMSQARNSGKSPREIYDAMDRVQTSDPGKSLGGRSR